METFISKSAFSEFTLSKNDAELLDLVQTEDDEYHLLHNGKSYRCKRLSVNFDTKTFVLEVNGAKHHIRLLDNFDQLIEKMGLSNSSSHKAGSVKAPMPGLILDIMVSMDQEVKQGDPIFILEAMKMENVIKADGRGTVKSIEVKKGQNVDKGQLIIEMD